MPQQLLMTRTMHQHAKRNQANFPPFVNKNAANSKTLFRSFPAPD
jgi:hypothetical protein